MRPLLKLMAFLFLHTKTNTEKYKEAKATFKNIELINQKRFGIKSKIYEGFFTADSISS